ncbi:hypothetical protein [Micromonospora cathayae]|uniref:Uncharacterized protein n=1 Tax=Micromonospora cathayae TaxID=3028804 RepID=A0ABY7ZSB4_9ACTN|nr:hypothetical protein [Micromonospora sp. HUAS 3]WDZ85925.1 hypothetical protein PVK37_05710 [Micromonospora sp. HUAS 3]
MAPVTPQQLAQTHIVPADAVLRNEVDYRGYPHRHLAVAARPGLTHSGLTQLMAAVEYLCPYGWELVNVSSGNSLFYAFLRRT